MALLFLDSCSYYGTADISSRWDSSYSIEVGSVSRHASGKSLEFSSSSNWIRAVMAPVGSTIIFGMALRIQVGDWEGIRIQDSTGNTQVSIGAADFKLRVSRGEDGDTILDTTLHDAYTAEQWFYLQCKFVVGNSGSYEIRVDNNIVLIGNADTQDQATSDVSRLLMFGSYLSATYLADVYICDESGSQCNDFLGDCRIDALRPDGAGALTQWDPSAGANYECVDEAINDGDTTYNSTNVVDEVDTFSFDDLTALGTAVMAVALTNVSRSDDSGIVSCKPVTRISGSNYLGDEVVENMEYLFHQQIWELNPADSAAWEEADINGAEFGIQLTANTGISYVFTELTVSEDITVVIV